MRGKNAFGIHSTNSALKIREESLNLQRFLFFFFRTLALLSKVIYFFTFVHDNWNFSENIFRNSENKFPFQKLRGEIEKLGGGIDRTGESSRGGIVRAPISIP